MIGVAIIGAGGVAHTHAKAVLDLSGRAREFAAAFSVPTSYADHRELLADPSVEMVIICAPSALHASMVVEALAAGKAVLCEKPIAASLAEIDAIAAAQARYGGMASSVFQWRYGEGLAAFRHLIEQGAAGRLLWAQANVLWRRTAEYYARGPWRGTWKGAGGGPLLTLAAHAIDALLSVMGTPLSVSSVVANLVHDVEVEDTSASVIRFVDGSMASINVTSANAIDTSRLAFVCEKMSACSNDSPYDAARWPWMFTSADPSSRSLIEALTRGAGTKKDIDLIELMTAIYKSGFTGSVVQLPISPADPFYAGMSGGHRFPRSPPAAGQEPS
jgi:predicted dehydrogenase